MENKVIQREVFELKRYRVRVSDVMRLAIANLENKLTGG